MTDTGVRYDETNPWSVFIGTHINAAPGRITMTEWGRRLDVSRDTLYRWLRGEIRTVTVEVAAKVAAGFGVDPDLAVDAARRAKQPPGQYSDLDSSRVLRQSAAQLRAATLPRDEGPVPPTFGPWLAKARQRAGYATAGLLAQEMDVDPQTVIDWEDGRSRPSLLECLPLARALRQIDAAVLSAAGHIQLDRAALAFQELSQERPPDDPHVEAIRSLIEAERRRD